MVRVKVRKREDGKDAHCGKVPLGSTNKFILSALAHRKDVMAGKQNANWGSTPWKIAFRAKARRLPDRVDAAIVGGGFTGLAAAALYKRLAPDRSVLVIEAERVGNGASGRTGGMALSETAAGNLPGLGDVLRGYRRILRQLGIRADLALPGVWELARGPKSMEGKPLRAMKRSPIDWQDSGRLRVVGKVPGGSVDPGKVVSGLARAAEQAGAQIAERARVERIELAREVRLHVRQPGGKRVVTAGRVLLAVNAGWLDVGKGMPPVQDSAQPRLTFAIATAPLRRKQIAAIGFASRRPFYTADLPYLWGRLMKNGGLIFGSGLVPAFGESLRAVTKGARGGILWSGLEQLDVWTGEPAARLSSLERRVRSLHPALRTIRVTHRWGGPILITRGMRPVFRRHPNSSRVIVLGGYSGHGVALSVYLAGKAARVLAGLEQGGWQIGRRGAKH
jgi:glycine/D-amino acid oxidase-like deaminating enzyme